MLTFFSLSLHGITQHLYIFVSAGVKKGGGGHPEHIPVFRAPLEESRAPCGPDPHKKRTQSTQKCELGPRMGRGQTSRHRNYYTESAQWADSVKI